MVRAVSRTFPELQAFLDFSDICLRKQKIRCTDGIIVNVKINLTFTIIVHLYGGFVVGAKVQYKKFLRDAVLFLFLCGNDFHSYLGTVKLCVVCKSAAFIGKLCVFVCAFLKRLVKDNGRKSCSRLEL